MIVLSHRGYWKVPSEKNQAVAFTRSFELGFGTETDIRDHGGSLLVSHDPPCGSELSLGDLVASLAGRALPLALNIKCDGIGPLIKQHLDRAAVTNWFTFDMSVPDMVHQLQHAIPAFTRLSDIERTPVLYREAAGVWLDAFYSDWYHPDLVADLIRDDKRVCIVSPELHGRDRMEFWKKLRENAVSHAPAVMLCTDFPEEARAFFDNGGKA